MKILVRGHVYPKAREIAGGVRKLREERRKVNIGSGTVGFAVYEVGLPEDTVREGNYLTTPQGVRLYHSAGDHYGTGYLISEVDRDPLASEHFSDVRENKSADEET